MIEQFHRPASLREALALKRRLRAAAFLAGGTYLNSGDFGTAATQVIALDGLGLDRVEVKSGRVVIGACATLQRLLDDRRVPAPLRAAIAQVVHRNIRNAATLGGHVAAALPQSDLVPMLVALDARVVLAKPAGGTRTLAAAAYAAKPAPGLVLRIEVPKPKAGRVAACRNLRESANARSIVSVAVAATLARGIVGDPVIAVAGVARTTVRATAAERALAGRALPGADALQALVSAAVRPVAMTTGSAALRRYSAGSLAALAFAEAAGAKGGRP